MVPTARRRARPSSAGSTAECDRRQHGQRQRREPAPRRPAAHAGQLGELQPVDAHRDDHGARLVGDHARALVHLHQRAGGGDAALGEHHQRLAVAHRAHHRLGAERVGRVDREVRTAARNGRAHQRSRDVDVDGEGGRARQERGDEAAVQEALVVDHDHRAPVRRRQVLQPRDVDPVEGPEVPAEHAPAPFPAAGCARSTRPPAGWRRRRSAGSSPGPPRPAPAPPSARRRRPCRPRSPRCWPRPCAPGGRAPSVPG